MIFQPSWGVPKSIKRDDILPSLRRGSTRLFTYYQLRIQRGGRDVDPASVDWATADIRNFHVYQPPGENNVLGNVKFRFPNKHDVYMHDTPTKNLFNAQVRAFSHGCMRVRDPQRLAELLLAEDQGWPADRVAAVVKAGSRTTRSTSPARSPCTSPTSPQRWTRPASSSSSPTSTATSSASRLGMEGQGAPRRAAREGGEAGASRCDRPSQRDDDRRRHALEAGMGQPGVWE